MELKMNDLQTPLTEDIKKELPKEVWDDILEYVSSVKMIQNLISPERGYITDRPVMTYINDDGEEVEYEDGRREIDITNPHRLENMDYFRERAIFYEKNGRYTNLIPNGNPQSEYAQFWKNELKRWKYGMVREDGEWIPGLLYFYWNYTQIAITKQDKKQKRKSDRIRSFPKPWLGDYLFYHYVEQAQNRGQHCKLLKTRGIGFSFKCAAWSPCNMYTKPGSQNPNFHLASEKTFLSGDKGIWGKVLDNLDWIANTTPFPRMRLMDKKQAMEIQLGYEDEYGVRRGLLSSCFGISMKDNPDKARGIRGPYIHYEEDGLFPNLEKAWNVNRKAVEDGGVASGTMFAGGTGGVEGASFEGSEKLFYSPGAYGIYGIPNVFDKNTDGETRVGFFWGAYMNRNLCYNEQGEPDVIKALIEICLSRHKVKYSSSDANAITQKKAEEPITPQEAIMRTEGTVFPVADLKEHLENIMVKKESFLAHHYVGDLVYNSRGDVEWRLTTHKNPIRAYDFVGDRSGAVEIFEMPKKNGQGQIRWGRYIAGIDPIDADEGPSLFSILVMDTMTDRIVAEYTGRPRRARDAYETCLKLVKFYNAEANYESNLKGLFSYFDERNALHYLADTPQILKDMEFIKATNLYGNRAKGTHLNQYISKFGRQLQADWMLQEAYGVSEEEKGKLNLHTLRSLALIEEYIKWNADGNFDRVSAGIMLFILREDRYKRIEAIKTNKYKNMKSLSNDPFFKKNYKGNVPEQRNVFEEHGE